MMLFNNLKDLSYTEFKAIYDELDGEPEFLVCFDDRDDEYMIIKYEDGPTFQRCGVKTGSGEIKFKTLDELYDASTVDNISFKNDWNKIRIYQN